MTFSPRMTDTSTLSRGQAVSETGLSSGADVGPISAFEQSPCRTDRANLADVCGQRAPVCRTTSRVTGCR